MFIHFVALFWLVHDITNVKIASNDFGMSYRCDRVWFKVNIWTRKDILTSCNFLTPVSLFFQDFLHHFCTQQFHLASMV